MYWVSKTVQLSQYDLTYSVNHAVSFETVFYLSIAKKAYCLVSNNRLISTSLHIGLQNAENSGSND